MQAVDNCQNINYIYTNSTVGGGVIEKGIVVLNCSESLLHFWC